jgi:3-hydroxyacyl-[acyl-carrier-protein] dehydratase
MTLSGATLTLEADHPSLAGHFPGNPIVPGVVLLDAALYALEQQPLHGQPRRSWQIPAVKFHHVVRPGEPVQLSFQSQPGGSIAFELRTAGTLVASGHIGADSGAAPA